MQNVTGSGHSGHCLRNCQLCRRGGQGNTIKRSSDNNNKSTPWTSKDKLNLVGDGSRLEEETTSSSSESYTGSDVVSIVETHRPVDQDILDATTTTTTKINHLPKYVCYICDEAFERHQMRFHLRMHRKQRKDEKRRLRSEKKSKDDRTCKRNQEKCEEEGDTGEMKHVDDSGIDGRLQKTTMEAEDDDDDDIRQTKRYQRFPCDICGGMYRKGYMPEHKRTHTGEKPHACQKCDKQFATAGALKVHVEIRHGDARGQFTCDLCQGQYTSRVGLKQHLLIHTEVRRFQCEVCGKAFKLSNQLAAHRKTHKEGMPYQCDACGRQYKNVRGLRRHRIRVHQGVRPTYPCQLCERVFTQPTALKDHVMWHNGASPYVCNHCGKTLLSRKILQEHLLIHEDRKPYGCGVCGKTFRQKCVLKRHMSVHTGIKPFSCEHCGKQFIHRVYLRKHTCESHKKV